MSPRPCGSIRGRVALSQRAWTLPDGRTVGWWSLAPTTDPSGDRAAREAARKIPAEHRETAWLIADDGAVWWALLDVRVDAVAYASLRDAPAPVSLAAHLEPAPEPLSQPPAASAASQRAQDAERWAAYWTAREAGMGDVEAHARYIAAPSPDLEPEHVEPSREPSPEHEQVEPDPEPVESEPAPTERTTTMPPTARKIACALAGFDVRVTVGDVTHGATVDRYPLTLAPGVKVSQVTRLADDLALALGADHVRVVASDGALGVEVPAAERATVSLASLQAHLPRDYPLRVPIGQAVDGTCVGARLDRLPHLLVAGTTGSGKSTWTSAVLAHLVTHAEPADLQLVLIDPKRVELAPFARVPHLWRDVATGVETAVVVLEDVLAEMEGRYARLEAAGARNIAELGDDAPPYLLVVVDELADLMMTAGKRAEAAVVRMLQVGRAAGVHLILATQRPSADVVTGLIKANAPSRLVFAVQSHVDSGVALGQGGAEALLGSGDALWWPSGASQPERIQAPYVSTSELAEVLAPIRRLKTPTETPAERDARVREGMFAGLRETNAKPAAVPPSPSVREHLVTPDLEADELLQRGLAPARHLDMAMEAAYQKGRDHAAALDPPMTARRVAMPSDYWIGALAFIAAVALSALALPILPILVGVWATYRVTTARRRINYRERMYL